jgi:glycosyltransferase involved in cell wall biosynthesis
MKLLFVIHSLKMGGAERVLVNTANYFASVGYEVHICLYDAEDIFYELDERVIVYGLLLEKLSSSLLSSVKNSIWRILSIREYIRRIDADVVISLITHVNVISILAAKSVNVPIIACEHSNYYLLKSKIFRLIRALVYPLADTVTVLTKGDIDNYPFKKNIVVLPNSLNTPAHYSIPKEKLVIGVGRLVKEKGFERLIEAFLRARDEGWRLEIVGEGAQRGMLEEKIMELGGEEFVSLVGARKDVGEFYARASIFVLSSREEGFPMALCEAMSCGVASIAFDCRSGPSEIITSGVDGVLVPPDDVDKLSISIKELMGDEIKRAELAASAKKINDKLGAAAIAKRWEEIFDAIVEKKA